MTNKKLTDEKLKRLIIIVKRSAFQFGLDKNDVEQFKEIHSALTELQEYRNNYQWRNGIKDDE
jgi:hypothetical protein